MKNQFISVLVILILLLGSLGLVASAEERPYEGVEIHLASGWDTPITAMHKVVDRFEELTGIKVIIEQIAWGPLYTKWVMESVGETGYFDVIRMSPVWISEAVEGGWIIPLDEIIEETGYDIADYAELALDNLGRIPGDDTIWALPLEPVVKGIAYRTDLFENAIERSNFKEQYGYELRPPRTTEELRDVAEFFTRDTTGDGEIDLYGFAAPQLERDGVHWLYYPIWSFGGEILDPIERIALINSPEVIEGFDWAIEMQQFQPRAVTVWASGDQVMAFAEGKLAMAYIEVMFHAIPLLDPEVSPYYDCTKFFVLPVYPDNPRGYTTGKGPIAGGGLAIPSASKNQEAAWEYISWVTSDQEALRVLASEGTLYAKAQVFEDPIILENPLFKKVLPIWSESVEHAAKSRPLISELVPVKNRIRLAWYEMLSEPERLEEIVFRLHRDIQQILDEGSKK